MDTTPDTQYDKSKPWNAVGSAVAPSPVSTGPFQSNMERLTTEALRSALDPRAVVAGKGVNLPQWKLFPARFGYRKDQPNIFDIVDAQRQYMSVNDFSGANAQINAGSTNSLGTV